MNEQEKITHIYTLQNIRTEYIDKMQRAQDNISFYEERVKRLDSLIRELQLTQPITESENLNPVEEAHSSLTWAKMLGIEILDPDGWRNGSCSLVDLISEEEFRQRAMQSTIRGRL